MDKEIIWIGIVGILFLITSLIFYVVAIRISDIKPELSGVVWFPFISIVSMMLLIYVPTVVFYYKNPVIR